MRKPADFVLTAQAMIEGIASATEQGGIHNIAVNLIKSIEAISCSLTAIATMMLDDFNLERAVPFEFAEKLSPEMELKMRDALQYLTDNGLRIVKVKE